MKNPLRDFNPELDKEGTFRPTIKNESLHQNSNNNGVTEVNFG
jgi:hypothetical protein